MAIKDYIPTLLEDHDLDAEQAKEAMKEMMSGTASAAQVAAFLIALKRKGETVEELTALAEAMREFSRRVHPKIDGYLLDTCGTGGDKTKTFNVSTTCAFVIAAAGIRVAKHGNRSFTSRCGSADVLEYLGLNLNMEPSTVEKSIEEVGIGFMFAPNFHPAMKYVAPVRREIGLRTVFNILGPLTNPAGANAQLIGVYDPHLLDVMCQAAYRLGCKSVMTVHGLDGIDEISVTGKTAVAEVRNGRLVHQLLDPLYLGIKRGAPAEIAGSDPETNATLVVRILSGKMERDDARVQMVLVNAAAGLQLCERSSGLKEGMEIAYNTIEEGTALEKLRDLVEFSGGNPERLESLV